MFFFEPDKDFRITRGDTGIIRLESLKDGVAYEDYTATLSVKKHLNDDDYVLRIECDNDKFQFDHEMTKKLIPGRYKMDIEYRADGMVATLGVWDMYVLKDVTR